MASPGKAGTAKGAKASSRKAGGGESSEADEYVVEKQLDDVEKTMIENGIDPELMRDAEKNFKKIIDESDVFVRVQGDQMLEYLIKNDRLPNALDKGSKREADYKRRRLEVEEELFGIPVKTKPTGRPTYGYLAGKDYDPKGWSHQSSSQYGDVIVRMKPNIKKRSTFADNDTWSSGQASSLSNPRAATLAGQKYTFGVRTKLDSINSKLNAAKNAKNINDWARRSETQYAEVHMHKSARAKDVGEIIYTKGKRPNATVQQWAKANGVKITIAD